MDGGCEGQVDIIIKVLEINQCVFLSVKVAENGDHFGKVTIMLC